MASTMSSYIPTNGSTVPRPAETLTAPWESLPWGAAISHALKGKITYADLASATQVLLYDRRVDANNRITLALDTAGANTGKFALTMVVGGVSATISTTAQLTPGIDQDFNVAFACTSTEVGIALNGTAETRVSHALGLPALSTMPATFAGMVYKDTVLGWAVDIGNAGLAEATA